MDDFFQLQLKTVGKFRLFLILWGEYAPSESIQVEEMSKYESSKIYE